MDQKAVFAKEMIRTWTRGDLSDLLQRLSPLDEVFDTAAFPRGPEAYPLKYFDGTLDQVFEELKTLDQPDLQRSPHLLEQEPHYVSSHLAVVSGFSAVASWWTSVDVAVLYRLKQERFGCCCSRFREHMPRGDFEARGPDQVFEVLARHVSDA